MKTIFKLIASLLLITASATAQKTNLTVKLIDKQLNEPIPFGNVMLQQNDKQIAIAITNLDGEAKFDSVPFGKYKLLASFVGFETKRMEIKLADKKTTFVSIGLQAGGGIICTLETYTANPPFVDSEIKSGQTFTREQLRNSPY